MKPQKKFFFNGRAIKALTIPITHLELNGRRNFFQVKKIYPPLIACPLSPPPTRLKVKPLKKKFFAASLTFFYEVKANVSDAKKK